MINSLRLPIDSWKQKQESFLFLFILILLLSAAIYWKFNSVLMLMICALIILVLTWMLFSVRNTLVIVFAYLAIIPSAGWGSGYAFFHGVYFNQLVLFGLFLVVLMWVVADKAVALEIHGNRFSYLDWAILIFLILSTFSALMGATGGFPLDRVRGETFFLWCYGFYFIYTRSLTIDSTSFLWNMLMLIIVAVSIEYIFLSLSAGNIANILVTRIVTQQPNLAQIAFPFLGSYVFFKSPARVKIVSMIAMLPIGAMMFLCQQRALWVGVFFSILLVSGFAFCKERFSIARTLKFTLTFFSILGLIILAFILLDWIFTGSVILTLITKLTSLTALSVDQSMNIRLSEIYRALDQWDNSLVTIIFGTGLGAKFESIDIMRAGTAIVDCSYVYILWKSGLIGLAAYTFLVFAFFRRGFAVFNRATDESSKQITAALMSAFAGLLVIGLTNTCLVRYRFIVIWAFILATIEILFRETERRRRSSNLLSEF